MLQTVRAEKVDEKNGVKCIKKCIFCNFVLTSARNLSLLKQSTYTHLKGLVTYFQKIVYCAMTYCFGDIRV